MSEKVTGREPEEEDGCARSLEAKLAEEEGEEGDTHRTGGPLTTLGLPAKAPHQGNLSSPIMPSQIVSGAFVSNHPKLSFFATIQEISQKKSSPTDC